MGAKIVENRADDQASMASMQSTLESSARGRLDDAALRFAGGALAALLPGGVSAAVGQVLALAAGSGRLVVLEVRCAADSAALALPWELLSLPSWPLPVRESLLEVARHVVLTGASMDPALDPAPAVPVGELGVLGFTGVADRGSGRGRRPGRRRPDGDSYLLWEREL